MNEQTAGTASPIPFVASFALDRPSGSVVGCDGAQGNDPEGVVGVDHGALRIRPLVEPGWGRSAISWGPYEPTCGLVASVLVLNGHNASENVDPWPSLPRFVLQWLRGTQVDPVVARLRALPRYGGRDTLARRLRAWQRSRAAIRAGTSQTDNLAVGLLGAVAPADASAGGAAFVVRSTGPTNAALCAGHTAATPAAVFEGLQNVPLQLVVILREAGAVYAAASLPGAGLGTAPALRPLLVDPTPLPSQLWVGVNQAVLGQVGWGVDSRVHDVRVARLPALSSWCTSAHAADRLEPSGLPVAGRQAERGGVWRSCALDPDRRVHVLDPGAPSGLVHAVVRLAQSEQRVGLAVRVGTGPGGSDGADHAGSGGFGGHVDGWVVVASSAGIVAERSAGGALAERHEGATGLPLAREVSVQVLDDGEQLRVVVEGAVVLGPFPAGPAAGHGVGLRHFGGDEAGATTGFEAHPLAFELPDGFAAPVPTIPEATVPTYADDFTTGPSDATLAGRLVGDGGGGGGQAVAWEHTTGRTPFRLGANGAVVQPVLGPRDGIVGKLASLVRPQEHRNAFTLPWPDAAPVDATVTLVAPGTGRGQGERGRGGLVFRQDADHQLIVNTWIDDEYGGTSVSSFLRIGGFEDVYDAVWTNVGRRITWGEPYDLRVAFDGDLYVVFVNAEPVLVRRVTDIVPSAAPLRTARVGIVANWEFGDDTGTRFLRFTASAGPAVHAGRSNGVVTPTCSTPAKESP